MQGVDSFLNEKLGPRAKVLRDVNPELGHLEARPQLG